MVEQEIKQTYMELQMIEQQIKQIQKQLGVIEDQIDELRMTKQSIEELENVKLDSETLVPIASGIFVKGVLKENNKFVVNVGGNTAVNKSKKEVIEMIDNQIADVLKIQNELIKNLQNFIVKARNIEEQISRGG